MMIREMVKAYAGFKLSSIEPVISTGKWGCGIFKGDPKLKLLIQWVAASLAGKKLIYSVFGNKEEQD